MFDDFLVLFLVSNFRTNLWPDPDPDQGILAIYSNPDLNILYPDGLKRFGSATRANFDNYVLNFLISIICIYIFEVFTTIIVKSLRLPLQNIKLIGKFFFLSVEERKPPPPHLIRIFNLFSDLKTKKKFVDFSLWRVNIFSLSLQHPVRQIQNKYMFSLSYT